MDIRLPTTTETSCSSAKNKNQNKQQPDFLQSSVVCLWVQLWGQKTKQKVSSILDLPLCRVLCSRCNRQEEQQTQALSVGVGEVGASEWTHTHSYAWVQTPSSAAAITAGLPLPSPVQSWLWTGKKRRGLCAAVFMCVLVRLSSTFCTDLHISTEVRASKTHRHAWTHRWRGRSPVHKRDKRGRDRTLEIAMTLESSQFIFQDSSWCVHNRHKHTMSTSWVWVTVGRKSI